VCQTKKHALQIATDELVKKTETTKSHSKFLENQQKKIDWRTLVLMRQEKDVKRLESENQKFQNVMNLLEIDHENYKDRYKDIGGTVQVLRKGLDDLNEKYEKSRYIFRNF
jgi:archaellum component FlaC